MEFEQWQSKYLIFMGIVLSGEGAIWGYVKRLLVKLRAI